MRKINPLLRDLKQAIKEHGGNAIVVLEIMEENRNWFSAEEISKARFRVKRTEIYRRHIAKQVPKDNDFYSQEDAAYIFNHYGTMKTRLLAALLNRTAIAVRDYFYRNAPKEKIAWVKQHGRYAGRLKNFKK